MNYERLARRFLDEFQLVVHADVLDDECPPWCDAYGGTKKGTYREHAHGRRYEVSIMDKTGEREELTFDFWESENDKLGDERPNEYPILSMVSSTIDAEPWDADENTKKRIGEFSEKAKKFFTPEELKSLKNLTN